MDSWPYRYNSKKEGILYFEVDFFAYGQLKTFSKDVNEKIKKGSVDSCNKDLKKKSAYDQTEKKVPGQHPKNT